MTASRRSHHKSRKGCDTCKFRHVKCDEVLPLCGECSRRNISCRYTQTQTVDRPNGRLSPSEKPSTRSASAAPLPDLPTETFLPIDLELMHFYCTSTYKTLKILRGDDMNWEVLWREELPNVAFKNPVLMHSILCLSATHLMHLNPNSPNYDYAIARHKHYALSLLRTELSSVSEPSSPMNDAIYGSAIFLVVQAIATFNTDSTSPIDLDWMPLLSGFRSFIGPMKPNISQSVFHPHMSHTRPDLPGPTDERRLRQKFNLESLFVSLPATYSEHVTRLACLLDPLFLDKNYQCPPLFSQPASPFASADVPDDCLPMTSLRYLLAWTATLPPSFIPRAQENDPAIITLLGWVFSIFRTIYLLQPSWWLERISKQGVEDIAKLTPEWRIHHENLP